LQVTLFEALTATLRKHPMVLAGAAEADAAAAEVHERNSRYLPRHLQISMADLQRDTA
jgi:hypothetical protein